MMKGGERKWELNLVFGYTIERRYMLVLVCRHVLLLIQYTILFKLLDSHLRW